MKAFVLRWFEKSSVSMLQSQYPPVANERVLWGHKPLLKGSFLLWDVENISEKRLEEIHALVKFTPEKLYAISKKALNPYRIRFFQSRGFILFEHYPLSADEKIINLIKVHQGCTHLILISSDSDFVPSIHRFLETQTHHVQWIMEDANKKRICMNVNLSHPRLYLSCLTSLEVKKPKRTHRPKTATKRYKKRYEATLIPKDKWINAKES